jgi:hypothetical protein
LADVDRASGILANSHRFVRSIMVLDASLSHSPHTTAALPQWVIDVDHEGVRQFLEPIGARYVVDRVWARGMVISATVLPGITLPVDDILRWRR